MQDRDRDTASGLQDHGIATKKNTSGSNDSDTLIEDLFEVIRSARETHTQTLLQMIRRHASAQEVRAFLDGVVSKNATTETNGTGLPTARGAPRRTGTDAGQLEHRSKVMDIDYMCNMAYYKVPAKPWTTVTDDDDLVSHLVSLYFTWDYPFYAFVDRDILLKHMSKGNVNSDLCSPFLVNAILANACIYVDGSEINMTPEDVNTISTKFLAEAERHLRPHQFDRGPTVRLASLQAALLLYERYSMSGEGGNGYALLNLAVEMGEALGIINRPKLSLSKTHMTEDMISSIKRTAWGLFQVDTVVHANFLRPCRVNEVSIGRIARDDSDQDEQWIPYPIDGQPRPFWMSEYFDEACRLSYIARDICHIFHEKVEPGVDLVERKEHFYKCLRQWESELPGKFLDTTTLAPHFVLLKIRYHALTIILSFEHFQGAIPCTAPGWQQSHGKYRGVVDPRALEMALFSAREISALVRLHRREFGIRRAHQYVMYVIMLALFTMLEHQSFDILDRDFLSLTSAFSVIYRHSPVGRKLFPVFRQSVTVRTGGRPTFDAVELAHQAQGLSVLSAFSDKAAQQGGYRQAQRELYAREPDLPRLEDQSPDQLPPMEGMLRMYERLSVGKEVDMRTPPPEAFRFSPSDNSGSSSA